MEETRSAFKILLGKLNDRTTTGVLSVDESTTSNEF
jgi:hypothetical protein